MLVGGAVVFGLTGPRMGQRGMRIRGIPATRLQEAVMADVLGDRTEFGFSDIIHAGVVVDPDPERVAAVATRDLVDVLGPAVEPPVLTDAGFELVGSRRLELVGVQAVRLNYRSEDTGRSAVVYELADPLAFVHFDTLGRQLPLMPGTRIAESILLEPSGGLLPAMGMVMIGIEGRATVIVTLGPEVAAEIAELVEPANQADSDSAVEGVATILEGGLEPMTRS